MVRVCCKVTELQAAQENSWVTWLLSPLYKKVEDSEEEKERKDRGRQESLLRKANNEVDAVDLADNGKT